MMKQTPNLRSVEKSLSLRTNYTGQTLVPAMLAVVFLTVAVVFPLAGASAQESETVEHGASFYYTIKKGIPCGICPNALRIRLGFGRTYGKETDRSPTPTVFSQVSASGSITKIG